MERKSEEGALVSPIKHIDWTPVGIAPLVELASSHLSHAKERVGEHLDCQGKLKALLLAVSQHSSHR